MGQGNRCQSYSAAQAPTISQMGHKGQGMGRGRGQDFQASALRTQGHVYVVVLQTDLADQSDIQGMFWLSHFLIKVLFKFECIVFMFIATQCEKSFVLEVETLEKSLHVNSPLGTRVSVDQICRDCESEISGILLTMDLRVMDISEFDVILRIDWLTAHRVVIDCDCRWVTTYTQDVIVLRFRGRTLMLYPKPCMTPDGVDS